VVFALEDSQMERERQHGWRLAWPDSVKLWSNQGVRVDKVAGYLS
jgi:hypothetical protein